MGWGGLLASLGHSGSPTSSSTPPPSSSPTAQLFIILSSPSSTPTGSSISSIDYPVFLTYLSYPLPPSATPPTPPPHPLPVALPLSFPPASILHLFVIRLESLFRSCFVAVCLVPEASYHCSTLRAKIGLIVSGLLSCLCRLDTSPSPPPHTTPFPSPLPTSPRLA